MGIDGMSSDEDGDSEDGDDTAARPVGTRARIIHHPAWRGEDANTMLDVIDGLYRKKHKRGKQPSARLRRNRISRVLRDAPMHLPSNFYGLAVDLSHLEPKEPLCVQI